MPTIRTTKQVPLTDIQTHPDNYNHGDAGAISLSLKHHGQYRAIVVSEATGNILAGNHTYLAAQMNGDTKMLAHLIPDLTLEQEHRIMLADNQYARLAYTDDNLLSELLIDLERSDEGLVATGYDSDDLDEMMQSLEAASSDDRGDLLGLLGVEITEPDTMPDNGAVYALATHILVVADVFTDIEAWSPYLADSDLFLPFPGPLLLLSDKAKTHTMLLVQPEPFIAGHILQHWVEAGNEYTQVAP